jgi:hypothetical protein
MPLPGRPPVVVAKRVTEPELLLVALYTAYDNVIDVDNVEK